jgi:hypothetical protein
VFTRATRAGKKKSGLQELIDRAKNQQVAANGRPIGWRVRDTRLAKALRRTFRKRGSGGSTWST